MRSLLKILPFLALTACGGLTTVDKDFAYSSQSAEALVVFFEPSSHGAYFVPVDLTQKRFLKGKMAFNGAPHSSGTTLATNELRRQDDSEKSSYTRAMYTSKKDNRRYYVGEDYRGFSIEQTTPGTYAFARKFDHSTGNYRCQSDGAAVYKIESGKANLIIGDFPYPLPASIAGRDDAGNTAINNPQRLFDGLEAAEESGELVFGGIPEATQDAIFQEFVSIIETYPMIQAPPVIAARVGTIAFEGKISWFDGGGCPGDISIPFQTIEPAK